MRGEQNKTNARTPNISVRTVEKHRGFLMKKLDYPNPEELTIVAKKWDLLTNNIYFFHWW